jgi:NADH-quinone oxidoreductase subunit C
VPDATGLELLAQELGEAHEGSVLGTTHFRGQAAIHVRPDAVVDALRLLRGKGYTFLASVHGVDYYPEEPRLGVQYELLDMAAVDRVALKLRVPLDAPEVPSVTPDWPTADHQEREVYDMFGVVFTGHPDLRRILMPDGWEGHPLRKTEDLGGVNTRYKGAFIPPVDRRTT